MRNFWCFGLDVDRCFGPLSVVSFPFRILIWTEFFFVPLMTKFIFTGTAFGKIKYSFNLTSEEAAYTMAIVFLGILGNLCYTFAVK